MKIDGPVYRCRHREWATPLEEYPYSVYPPYVHGGAYVLSREALRDVYRASVFTRYIRCV